MQGNPVAVVHDAGALTDDVMHAFARETRLSETSFVQPADADGADYRHRIWTMDGEIPFAGHPSLGTAVAVARARGGTSLVQQTRPGLQRIDVEFGDGAAARASMLQEPPSFGPELDPEETLRLVGLSAADGDPELPPQLVSTGVPQLLVPVRDADALARARPDYDAIGPLLVAHEAIVYYLVHVQADGRISARSFMRTAEMGEDPATGSAAGPLCAYVADRGGPAGIEIDQGAEIGRASRLYAAIEGDRVRVEGDVVTIIDGTLELDF